MIAWLESLPTFVTGILVVGGFVLSTMLMGYLVTISTSDSVRATHNDRAGFILAVIGVVYAVLLAFVAIGVWERFEQAQIRSYEEASALSTAYRDAGSFPHGARVRELLREYVRSVVVDEWPRMQRGDKSGISDRLIERADDYASDLPVASARLQNIHAQMIAAFDTAMEDRQNRLTIEFIGINGIMWAVLIAGAYITVGFTYLFGFERALMQQLMIAGLSLMIGLVLFLVLALDFPFRGSIAVTPAAFHTLLANWGATP